LEFPLKKFTCLEISLILLDNVSMTNFNATFRHHHKATNVLAFPLYERELRNMLIKGHKYLLLGDILLAREVIEQESLEQNIFFKEHLRHLVVHGILHLLGFDHRRSRDARDMIALETVILQRLDDIPY
jgi:probable rRNA maturation factor